MFTFLLAFFPPVIVSTFENIDLADWASSIFEALDLDDFLLYGCFLFQVAMVFSVVFLLHKQKGGTVTLINRAGLYDRIVTCKNTRPPPQVVNPQSDKFLDILNCLKETTTLLAQLVDILNTPSPPADRFFENPGPQSTPASPRRRTPSPPRSTQLVEPVNDLETPTLSSPPAETFSHPPSPGRFPVTLTEKPLVESRPATPNVFSVVPVEDLSTAVDTRRTSFSLGSEETGRQPAPVVHEFVVGIPASEVTELPPGWDAKPPPRSLLSKPPVRTVGPILTLPPPRPSSLSSFQAPIASPPVMQSAPAQGSRPRPQAKPLVAVTSDPFASLK